MHDTSSSSRLVITVLKLLKLPVQCFHYPLYSSLVSNDWIDRTYAIDLLKGFERRTLKLNFKLKKNVPRNIKGERRLNNQIRMALEYIRNQINTHSDCTLLVHLLYLTSLDCTLLACIRYSPNISTTSHRQ